MSLFYRLTLRRALNPERVRSQLACWEALQKKGIVFVVMLSGVVAMDINVQCKAIKVDCNVVKMLCNACNCLSNACKWSL